MLRKYLSCLLMKSKSKLEEKRIKFRCIFRKTEADNFSSVIIQNTAWQNNHSSASLHVFLKQSLLISHKYETCCTKIVFWKCARCRPGLFQQSTSLYLVLDEGKYISLLSLWYTQAVLFEQWALSLFGINASLDATSPQTCVKSESRSSPAEPEENTWSIADSSHPPSKSSDHA